MLVDLHTTNGSYHAYHLTYSPILNPNADARLIAFQRERMLPAIQAAVLKKSGFRTYYYGNFSPEGGGGRESARIDPANPGTVTWRTFDHRPRFGNNYAGLRNRIAILSEAYSYLDFKRRIDVTAAFVEEVWRSAADNAERILLLTAQADRQFTAPATQKPVELGVDFQIRALPDFVDIAIGDVKKQLSPRSGKEMSQMTDLAVPVKMKDYGVFEATRLVPMPKGWLIPKPLVESPRMAAAIDRLKWHGLVMRTISSDGPVTVERFLIDEVVRAERPFQGRREARLRGTLQKAQLSVSAGSLFVPANQPLARLAFYLLEPESDDGLVTWNIIEEGLAPGETYPIYRVLNALPLSFDR